MRITNLSLLKIIIGLKIGNKVIYNFLNTL